MEQPYNAGSGSASTQGVMDRVRNTATAQLSAQKTRATDGLGSLASAVRQTTQPLRDNQQDAIAQYVEKAADQIDRFSSQLRDKDVSELVSDAQRFARRQPAVFIGAAFTVGVLAARFLKSSSQRSGESWGTGESWGNADMSRRASGHDDLRSGSGLTTPGTAPYSTGGPGTAPYSTGGL